MKKKVLKGIMYFMIGIVGLVITGVIAFQLKFALINRKAKSQLTELKTIQIDGFSFHDMNKNGKLNI